MVKFLPLQGDKFSRITSQPICEVELVSVFNSIVTVSKRGGVIFKKKSIPIFEALGFRIIMCLPLAAYDTKG